ncbi:fimbrial protein FimF [Escherichia coli]|nr:fimbrial protein FimF [Escherichia coli]OKX62805.1 fimbrial protein FimF [Escherichia coli]
MITDVWKYRGKSTGMQWIPLVPEQNNILPYSARLKSTQKSVNPGLVRASATFTLEFQ